MKKILVAPSILSADFANLANELKRMENARADLIHVDVMDGHYVPNITLGLIVVEWMKKYSKIPFDTHLMISEPDKYALQFAKAGSKWISFHVETSKNPKKLLHQLRKAGAKAGLAVNANVPVKKVFPYLKYCDYVLVMSVMAGFAGQKFKPSALKKIKALAKERKKRKLKFLIEIDGGVTEENAPLCRKAGAEMLVSGTTIFKSKNPKKTIQVLRGK